MNTSLNAPLNTSITHRLAAATAAMAITFALFSAVVSEAAPPAGAGPLIAQSATPLVR